ncbi:HNH endonuclease signature motif containing protein [Agrococcus citreus]|uniref:HNH nuclease domain-containing protein n=1 Tax=Agrococcus citreus TaxID=84643 RepID=A0ABP4JKT8_9MICO
MDVWVLVYGPMFAAVAPYVPWVAAVIVALAVIRCPLFTRHPVLPRRDPWRTFKYAPRAAVMERAAGRCEAAAFYVAGRCSARATEVDHIFPWSRGGPTVESNGQALCRPHNRSKGRKVPAWWYLLLLERRRRTYFPAGVDVRVLARMSVEDRAARSQPRLPEPRRRAPFSPVAPRTTADGGAPVAGS